MRLPFHSRAPETTDKLKIWPPLTPLRELARRHILVDFRPCVGIRIVPHFYTADDEIDATMQAIHTILETKAYEPYLSQGRAQF